MGYLEETFLGKDGRLHAEFVNAPDTGRLASRKPNLQNQPQEGRRGDVDDEIASAIRGTIKASPGCKLIEIDWNSMEAQLLAYFANEPAYGRMSKLGAHAYMLSHYVGKPTDVNWEDDKIKRYHDDLKKQYPSEYQICKICNLADSYDIGVDHLAKQLNRTRKEAQEMKDLRKRMFPNLAAWQKDVRMRAHVDGKLMNPFGYLRYFFEVFKKRTDGTWGLGREAWEVLAFLPQSTNAAMMREVILLIDELQLDFAWLLIGIHDAVLMEAIEDRVDETIQRVLEIMTRPWAELGGLSIGVDIKTGFNWSKKEMKDYHGV